MTFNVIVHGFAAIVIVTFSAVSCVSPDKPSASRRVIDRTPGLEETPAWIRGKNKVVEGPGEGDRVVFKGHLTMESDANPSNCSHAAGTDAKGRLASLISNSVTDEAGIAGDERATVSNRLTAILADQRIAGAEIEDEYYELIEIDDGDKAIRKLECFAQVSIKKSLFDKLVAKAIADIVDEPGFSKHRSRLEKVQDEKREDAKTK